MVRNIEISYTILAMLQIWYHIQDFYMNIRNLPQFLRTSPLTLRFRVGDGIPFKKLNKNKYGQLLQNNILHGTCIGFIPTNVKLLKENIVIQFMYIQEWIVFKWSLPIKVLTLYDRQLHFIAFIMACPLIAIDIVYYCKIMISNICGQYLCFV